MVVVRQRPLNRKEKAIRSRNIIRIIDSKVVVLLKPGVASNDYLRHERNRKKRNRSYAFDHAFDEACSNQAVYDHTISLLINGVVNGYNSTIFAYGATGAGKTYTMTGTTKNPGLMVLTLQDLFGIINTKQSEYCISISYLEVYNEHIRDLLNFDSDGKYLALREDPIKGIVVAGITEIYANSAMHILELLQKGNKNRTTESTAANTHSSRSHAVLQVVIQNKDLMTDTVKIAKLNMIDLAGSERASITSNRGVRLLEGANINRSLLALANCINALAKGQRKRFVPYRDSKLTRLLKDSLGGNCRTVMIANASPADFTYEDTSNTLKYANRAKNIKTKQYENVMKVDKHIDQYQKTIKDLRHQLNELKQTLPNCTQINYNLQSNLNKKQQSVLNKARAEMLEKFSALSSAKTAHQNVQQEIIKLIQENNAEQIQGKLEEKKKLFAECDALSKSIEQFGERTIGSAYLKDANNEYLLRMIEMEYKGYKMQTDRLDLQQNTKLLNAMVQQKDIAIRILEDQLKLRDDLLAQYAPKEYPTKSIIKYDELKQRNQMNQNTFNCLCINSNKKKKKNLTILVSKENCKPMKCRVTHSNRVSNVVSSGFNTNKTLYPSFRALRQHKLKQLQQFQNESIAPHPQRSNVYRKPHYRARQLPRITHSKAKDNAKYKNKIKFINNKKPINIFGRHAHAQHRKYSRPTQNTDNAKKNELEMPSHQQFVRPSHFQQRNVIFKPPIAAKPKINKKQKERRLRSVYLQ
eukprot:979805_1